MKLEDRIKKIIDDQGFDHSDNARTIYTTCPLCGRDDKFSILKDNGACRCYHGSCDFGIRWFEDWISLTAKISRKKAVEIFRGFKERHKSDQLPFDLFSAGTKPKDKPLERVRWPEGGFFEIDSPESLEGANYLISRGIPLNILKFYDIRYSPWFRRVIFPIKMHGHCYGWQGRAIDVVDKEDRMRNNLGFRRDSLIMFLDLTLNRDSMILCEGPVDAMKFYEVGGAVATMGKEVTDKQLELINKSGVSTVYLALDGDAALETMKLRKRINSEIQLKLLIVPQSCEDRCKIKGKKADFGECTFAECRQALENAVFLGDGHILI